MKFSEASVGRVFVIRLNNDEVIHETLEKFASEKNVKAASIIILGGIKDGSILVTGPADGYASPPVPMTRTIENVCEIAGTGTIFPNSSGKPELHMHICAGRERNTITGCVKKGVRTWHVLEVIMTELTGTAASRKRDEATGFHLLEPV